MWKGHRYGRRCELSPGTILHAIPGMGLDGEFTYRGTMEIGTATLCTIGGFRVQTPGSGLEFWPWRFRETNCEDCTYLRRRRPWN